MTHPQQLAVAFFKRNPEATVAHIVANMVFASASRAAAAKKAYKAKLVTVVLRDEVKEHLPASTNSLTDKSEKNDNRRKRPAGAGGESAAQSERQ